MNLQEIKKDLPIQCLKNLQALYEMTCEEYRRRICEQWGYDIYYSYWIPTDRVGEVLAINDCMYSLSMDDVRMFVERGTSYEDFSEWWEHIVTNDYGQNPCINAYSWFTLGARPEILKDNAEHKKN